MTCGVSIPAYRNIESLRRCLDSVLRHSPVMAASIVVVDDSGDGRVATALRDGYPMVTWLVHASNRGFGATATEAVLENPADVVVLLNDDTELLTDPLPVLSKRFADADIFAVTFQSLDAHDRFREGAKRLVWRFGMPRVLHKERDQLRPFKGIRVSSYAVGGHAAFDRSRFAKLGGFDPMFEPFYWEDVDLAVRALQRGWRCIYAPECVVRHAGPSAIRSSNDRQRVREITERNRLLFAWKHARPVQMKLLTLATKWALLEGKFRRDPVFARALQGARARWCGRSKMHATTEGVAVGR